jgi:hypothetical protein
MRKLMIAAIALFAWQFSNAQNLSQENVPALVVNALQQQFPKAVNVEWERKNDQYEAEFKNGLGGFEHKIMFDAMGKIAYHKQDLAEKDLPAALKNSLAKELPGFHLHDIEKIESGKVVTYKLEAQKGKEEWNLTLDAAGKILEKRAD